MDERKIDNDFFENMDFGETLKSSFKECLEHERGERKLRTVIRAIIPKLTAFRGHEVKEIRASIGFTQEMFAELFGVTKTTVEYWESGKNTPNGPSQRLLSLIKNKEIEFIKHDLAKIG